MTRRLKACTGPMLTVSGRAVRTRPGQRLDQKLRPDAVAGPGHDVETNADDVRPRRDVRRGWPCTELGARRLRRSPDAACWKGNAATHPGRRRDWWLERGRGVPWPSNCSRILAGLFPDGGDMAPGLDVVGSFESTSWSKPVKRVFAVWAASPTLPRGPPRARLVSIISRSWRRCRSSTTAPRRHLRIDPGLGSSTVTPSRRGCSAPRPYHVLSDHGRAMRFDTVGPDPDPSGYCVD